MTTPLIAGSIAASATSAGSRRTDLSSGATGAHKPRDARPFEAEFGAMLLLAGLPDPAPLAPVRTATESRQRNTPDGVPRQRATDPTPSGAEAAQPAANSARSATSLAVQALTQSQADRLRTIGPGVSLSQLAQAELTSTRPPGATGVNSGQGDRPAEWASRSTRADGDATSNADRSAARSNDIGARATLGTSAPPPAAVVAGVVAARLPATTGSSASVASLDRLSGATARAQAGRLPASAVGTPAAATYSASAVRAPQAAVSQSASSVASGTARPVGVATNASEAGARTSGARRPDAPSRAQEPREQFVAQVHRALGLALRAKDGPVTLHLTPEHLGQLRVELSHSEDGVHARFDAATPEARRLLESSLADLKAALEARGLHVERLEVRLTESAGSGAEHRTHARDDPAHADQRGTTDGGDHPDHQPDPRNSGDGDRPHDPGRGAPPDTRTDQRSADAGRLLQTPGPIQVASLSTIELVA